MPSQHLIIEGPFSEDIQTYIDKIYRNIFCSMPARDYLIGDTPAQAYLKTVDDVPNQVILFEPHGGRIKVLNKNFRLPPRDLDDFCRCIFCSDKKIDVIVLPSVATDTTGLEFVAQCFNITEDIVIYLPATREEYTEKLGKNTRESIRRYMRRLSRDFPDIEFRSYERESVELNDISELISLNEQRIRNKNQSPSHTDAKTEQLKRAVKDFGVTLIAKRQGIVCGGVVCTCVEGCYYMHVIAHDPIFDFIRLGKICCYLSICDAIDRGATEYHMLAGVYDYKLKFLGIKRDFDKVLVYRSAASKFFNLGTYVEALVRGNGRRTKSVIRQWRQKWTS